MRSKRTDGRVGEVNDGGGSEGAKLRRHEAENVAAERWFARKGPENCALLTTRRLGGCPSMGETVDHGGHVVIWVKGAVLGAQRARGTVAGRDGGCFQRAVGQRQR